MYGQMRTSTDLQLYSRDKITQPTKQSIRQNTLLANRNNGIDCYQNEWPWLLFRGRIKVKATIVSHSPLNISWNS